MAAAAANWERLVRAALQERAVDHAIEELIVAVEEVRDEDIRIARILSERAYTLCSKTSSLRSGVLKFKAGLTTVIMKKFEEKETGPDVDRSQDFSRLHEFCMQYGEKHQVYKFPGDDIKQRVSNFICIDNKELGCITPERVDVLVTLAVIWSVTEACRRDLCSEDEAEIISKEVRAIRSSLENSGDRPRLSGIGTTEYDIMERMLDVPSEKAIRLPLEFLNDITFNFSDTRELGRGGYGIVYKGVLRNGKAIAVKKLFNNIHLLNHDQFENEVICQMRVKHQNIVRFIGYCAESHSEVAQFGGRYVMAEVTKRLLCFEYIHNNSLKRHISDETHGLDWPTRYEIIKGICHGIHHLHDECHIIHLDLKPENILIDYYMVPKIADFGLSRLFGEHSRIITTTCVGSRGYTSPEYLNSGVITKKADIFSLGVIIIELMTGCREYPKSVDEIEYFTEKVLTRWKYRFLKECWETFKLYSQQVKQCIVIGLNCVDPDPNNRPTSLYMMHNMN